MSPKPLDLAGKRFGDLEVLERCGSTDKGASLWRCLCHRCGNECLMEGQRLNAKQRPPKNCGCKRREREKDLTGGVYGALTVLSKVGKYSDGSITYLCRCANCGQEKVFPSFTIRTCPKGCGCVRSSSDRMKNMSDYGVKAKFVDADNGAKADIVAVKSDKAMSNSKTGVRGVFLDKKRNTYRAAVQVAGEVRIRAGFASVESAKAAYNEMKQELIEKYGLEKFRG